MVRENATTAQPPCAQQTNHQIRVRFQEEMVVHFCLYTMVNPMQQNLKISGGKKKMEKLENENKQFRIISLIK